MGELHQLSLPGTNDLTWALSLLASTPWVYPCSGKIALASTRRRGLHSPCYTSFANLTCIPLAPTRLPFLNVLCPEFFPTPTSVIHHVLFFPWVCHPKFDQCFWGLLASQIHRGGRAAFPIPWVGCSETPREWPAKGSQSLVSLALFLAWGSDTAGDGFGHPVGTGPPSWNQTAWQGQYPERKVFSENLNQSCAHVMRRGSHPRLNEISWASPSRNYFQVVGPDCLLLTAY